MRSKEYEAALLDLDGTVLDTTVYIHSSYRHSILTHLGIDVTWEELRPHLGLPLDKIYQRITGLARVDHLVNSHNEFQYGNLHLAAAYPDALPTLEALRRNGISIAAVTSRYGDQVSETLRLCGVRSYFKVVITPREVKKPKPDAEPVLRALEILGISPHRAVMIGDSPEDIWAGRNAGVRLTIGALYGFCPTQLAGAKPDHLVNNISEIIPLILR